MGYQKDKLKEKAVDVFWKIAILESTEYSKELVEPSRKHLVDLIRQLDRGFKDMYALNCI